MKSLIWIVIGLFFSCTTPREAGSKEAMPRVVVSTYGRFLNQEDGRPFFWLGDTGWLLPSKLDRQEAEIYFEDRRKKGFNVIQAMVLHRLDVVNAYGDSALIAGALDRPNYTAGTSFKDEVEYDYWDHLDFLVDLAASKGLYLALVPIWGNNVKQGTITTTKAQSYASWLAERYAAKNNIIWLNGGDAKGDQQMAIWQAIGQAISAHAPRHLITFHPFGRTQSSWWFHETDWLDFNMFQSGHRRYDQDDTVLAYGEDNWKYVRDDYARAPTKPTLDGEPSYEGIPQGLHDPAQPYWQAEDVRRYAYWSVFAGACGFTYGHSAVMQMHKPGDLNPAYGVRTYWTDALQAAGAKQVGYLKQLLLSESYFDRVPDQSLLASNTGERYDYQLATRGSDYAFIYTYTGQNIEVQMGKIKGTEVVASWFNPRTGEQSRIGRFNNEGIQTFDPPGQPVAGNDFVLILEGKQ
ncbi:MAG: glycoside hydrolase family 140 protein [Phaeodactylibacter sp.]|nr:glycoside hydrolase family 140 protein [Phaeodactylibacter sp.]